MSDNNDKNNNKPKDVSEPSVHDDIKKSALSEQWQKIFDELKIDDQEYKIFLSVSSKLDDGGPTGPISPMFNPKK